MIHAILRGKLRPDGSNAHERCEDLLTSTVFGMLRYLPLDRSFIPLMSRARPACTLIGGPVPDISSPWIDVSRAASCAVEFWPSLGRYGQPDLLLTFRDASGAAFHLVAIEAKLFSPKSGEAADAEDDSSDTEDDDLGAVEATPPWNPDQLVRYWRGLDELEAPSDSVQRSLVYLTAHPSPPLKDLSSSLGVCPEMRLGWISWRHIWQVLAAASPFESPSPAADLYELLRDRGFGALDAFRSSLPDAIPASGFWRHWFSGLVVPATVPSCGFREVK